MPLSSFLARFAVALAFCAPAATAETAALQADLPVSLAADTLNVGSSFVLKVNAPWQQAGCNLAPGSVLHAVVRNVERNGKGRTTGIGFTIEAPCADEHPVALAVTSLLAPLETESLGGQFFRSSSFGGGTGLGSAGNTQANHVDLSGRQNPSLPFSNGEMATENLPRAVHVGEVWHIPKLRLTLPHAGSTASTLSTSAASLHLPAKTLFILQSMSTEAGSSSLVAAGAAPAPPPAVKTISSRRRIQPLIRPCVPGRCTIASSSQASMNFGAAAPGTRKDLAPFGFRTERNREFLEMQNGASVHFLGNDELLVTFPSFGLVGRPPSTDVSSHPRTVRAVVFNTITGSVTATQDWLVEDGKPYIWSLGDHVLVHEADALKLFGPGLTETSALPLDSGLAFLRTTPDAQHVLVGSMHEVHNKVDHDLLQKSDIRGSEEEVRWLLLDGALSHAELIGTSSSFMLPPVLLNSGLIELRKEDNDHWHLVRRSWADRQPEPMGSFRSSCRPEIASTAADLLAISTCDSASLDTQTFLLHEDGSPVRDQASRWHDLPLAFAGAPGTDRLALLVTRGTDEYTRGKAFHLSLLKSQSVEVVDLRTGAPLASLAVPEPSPYTEAVALSPNASHLALLSGHSLLVYDLGSSSPATLAPTPALAPRP